MSQQKKFLDRVWVLNGRSKSEAVTTNVYCVVDKSSLSPKKKTAQIVANKSVESISVIDHEK